MKTNAPRAAKAPKDPLLKKWFNAFDRAGDLIFSGWITHVLAPGVYLARCLDHRTGEQNACRVIRLEQMTQHWRLYNTGDEMADACDAWWDQYEQRNADDAPPPPPPPEKPRLDWIPRCIRDRMAGR